jgi:hypothetical protein
MKYTKVEGFSPYFLFGKKKKDEMKTQEKKVRFKKEKSILFFITNQSYLDFPWIQRKKVSRYEKGTVEKKSYEPQSWLIIKITAMASK